MHQIPMEMDTLPRELQISFCPGGERKFEADGSIVDIEMQVLDKGNLRKRFCFYGAMADTQMLEKGMVYSKLRDSYVIVICPFDLYGEVRRKYMFTNRCKDNSKLEMGDGSMNTVLSLLQRKVLLLRFGSRLICFLS